MSHKGWILNDRSMDVVLKNVFWMIRYGDTMYFYELMKYEHFSKESVVGLYDEFMDLKNAKASFGSSEFVLRIFRSYKNGTYLSDRL